MNFAFSEDQELFRRTVREFAERELAPKYAHWDKTEDFPWEISRKMGELGLTGLRVPEQYGGMEADFITCGIAAEECSRADINCTFFVMMNLLSGNMLANFGTDQVKEEWLPALARGAMTDATALPEPQCGSDAAALATRAIKEGDE